LCTVQNVENPKANPKHQSEPANHIKLDKRGRASGAVSRDIPAAIACSRDKNADPFFSSFLLSSLRASSTVVVFFFPLFILFITSVVFNSTQGLGLFFQFFLFLVLSSSTSI
jgi:hypothetical protein